MLEHRSGNLFEDDSEALVNAVNCVGVMGRGIALQFKKAFPANFKAYAAACQRGEVVPGRMWVFATGGFTGPRFIVNFPTKRHWKGNSRLEDIRGGLVALVSDVQRLGIRSIAIPALGAGLGGLHWSVVRPLIEAAMAPLTEVRVHLYAPTPASTPP